MLALTFHSATQDHLTLRRLAAQVDDAIKSIPQVAETTLIGGVRRAVRVQLDPAALVAHGSARPSWCPCCSRATASSRPARGRFANTEVLLETGTFLRDADDVGALVVGVDEDPAGLPARRRHHHRWRRGTGRLRPAPRRPRRRRRQPAGRWRRRGRRHPERREAARGECHRRRQRRARQGRHPARQSAAGGCHA
jgi:hypothetical protein